MISGTTKLCFVVADPVKHLRTPQALNQIWDAAGRDIVAVPAQVSTSNLHEFVAGIRANASVLGTVVTVPHKTSVVGLCDELGPNARIVRAVNVIRRSDEGRLVGETFDGLGFVAGLAAAGIDPARRRVVLIGAGGAASAVAVALLSAGAASLDVSNRTARRAGDLVSLLRAAFPLSDVGVGLDRIAGADLIINATSAGLSASDQSPVESTVFPPGSIAADVVMSTQLTPFLAAAAASGNPTHEGSYMLAGQIQLISQFLTESGQQSTDR